MNKFVLIFPFLLLALSFFSSEITKAYGHSFTVDDSIYFVTLAKMAEIELNLAYETFPNNITLAIDHMDDAARLINDVYYVDDNIVVDKDFMDRYNRDINSLNTTTHALVMATLIDKTLQSYSNSINLTGFDLTNMSNLLVIVGSNNTLSNEDLVGDISNIEGNILSNIQDKFDKKKYKMLFSEKNPILYYKDYSVAKDLAQEVINIFQINLKSFVGLNKSNNLAVIKLEEDLNKLNDMIRAVNSPANLMKLVHLEIQPNLQNIYSLKINIPT